MYRPGQGRARAKSCRGFAKPRPGKTDRRVGVRAFVIKIALNDEVGLGDMDRLSGAGRCEPALPSVFGLRPLAASSFVDVERERHPWKWGAETRMGCERVLSQRARLVPPKLCESARPSSPKSLIRDDDSHASPYAFRGRAPRSRFSPTIVVVASRRVAPKCAFKQSTLSSSILTFEDIGEQFSVSCGRLGGCVQWRWQLWRSDDLDDVSVRISESDGAR